MDIPILARTRAECAARLEELSGDLLIGDPEERKATALARIAARAAYRRAEEEFQRAGALLSEEELAAVRGAKREERAA